MTSDQPLNVPFLAARTALRKLGIDLTVHSGGWCVNYHGAGAETAYFTQNLQKAIEHGRAMAAASAQANKHGDRP